MRTDTAETRALALNNPKPIEGFSRWSEGLRSLLLGSGDAKGAARIIAINPTLRAQAEAQLPWLERALEPAEPEQILLLLARHAPALGLKDMSEESWGLLFEPYLEALGDLPLTALEEAFIRWNKGELYPKEPGRHAFFPRPAEIRKLAEPARNELGKAANRIKLAIKHVENAPKPEPSAEEKAAVRAQMQAEGFLVDGKFVLPKKDAGPRPAPTGETPQQMAARLRAEAERFEDEF
jgi:hypothetical protein